MPKIIDLSNNRYGRLTVIKRDKKTQLEKKSKDVFWLCKCDCGNIVSKRGHDLRQNKILSCGCLKKENAKNINFKDMTGAKIGKLTVISKCAYNIDNHSVWHCKCECGNEIDIMGKHLRNGTSSCGCIKSKGEEKITSLLKQLNINFETQKSFEECVNVLPLKFDFYLPKFNIIIEYQGKQHFESIPFFGGEHRFKQQQENDEIKRKWCLNNSIKLIEIPYFDFSKIDENYLLEKIKKE